MPRSPKLPNNKAVTRIGLAGFKSFIRPQSVEFRELTLLAGANSSGKSSLMQAVLLLKQSLEVSYYPGTLLLDGPNVKFSSADQMFSRLGRHKKAEQLEIEVELSQQQRIKMSFRRHPTKSVEIAATELGKQLAVTLRPGMTSEEILAQFPDKKAIFPFGDGVDTEYFVTQRRFLLAFGARTKRDEHGFELPAFPHPASFALETFLKELIHLPGLRGNPSRTYPMTAVGELYPGTFENYTAAIVAHWQEEDNRGKLDQLNEDLAALGLTWKVAAKRISDTQVELMVGRMTKAMVGGAWDLVSIADVGFGLSQTLPVVVALHAAKAGQTVYLEQPEIHLHPRAQVALAIVLAKAIQRKIHVVVETHSALLLLALQSLVVEGRELSPDQIKLHWFTRDAKDGATIVTSADIDSSGSFGEWPVDFGKVELDLENRYLNALDKGNSGT